MLISGNGLPGKRGKKASRNGSFLRGEKLRELLRLLGRAEAAVGHYARRGMDDRIIRLLSDEPNFGAKKFATEKGLKELDKMAKRYFKEECPGDGEPRSEIRKDEETGDPKDIVFPLPEGGPRALHADRRVFDRLAGVQVASVVLRGPLEGR